MATIDVNDQILINGVATDQVATTLITAGIAQETIAEIIGYWYLGAVGAIKPAPFDFSTDVEAIDPNCEVDYVRSFAHTDFIDGETRVQAGSTPEELGFNARFHSIENEFDAISAQMQTLGACIQEVRSDLVGVVAELESKLTSLQNQLFELEDGVSQSPPITGVPGGGIVLGDIQLEGQDYMITKVGEDIKLVGFAGDVLGTSPRPTRPEFDPRVNPARDFVRVVDDIDGAFTQPGLRDLFEAGDPVTVAELRRHGSTITLGSGTTLGAVLAAMPSDVGFTSPEAAINGVTRAIVNEAPAATRSELKRLAVGSGNVGLDRGALANAGLSTIGATSGVLAAMENAGIRTIADISGATASGLRTRLAGSPDALAEVGDLLARARLATALA